MSIYIFQLFTTDRSKISSTQLSPNNILISTDLHGVRRLMKTQVCVSDALLIYTITRVLEPRHNDSTSAQNGNLHQSVVTRIRMDNPAPPASKATSKIFSLCNPAPPAARQPAKSSGYAVLHLRPARQPAKIFSLWLGFSNMSIRE